MTKQFCARFVPKISQNNPKSQKFMFWFVLDCFRLIYYAYWIWKDAGRCHLVTSCLSFWSFPPFHGGNTGSNPVRDANFLYLNLGNKLSNILRLVGSRASRHKEVAKLVQ